MVIGSYIGSKLVLDEHFKFTEKTIKYITAIMTLVASILFFIDENLKLNTTKIIKINKKWNYYYQN